MVLKIKHFVVFITMISVLACREEVTRLSKIQGQQIDVDSTQTNSDSIDQFVAPYRQRINEVLDSALAYAPYTISKTDGKLNTTAGNLMADIVRSEAEPIFKKRTGKTIDFVLLNHGGIRSIISKGIVSARTAFEIMPFENTIVVVALDGKSVLDLVA
ncbi:MAG: hypothetical protein HKN31_07275, partial [Pricia sp.]|nr:hypothetical protein [Pricia sp.]